MAANDSFQGGLAGPRRWMVMMTAARNRGENRDTEEVETRIGILGLEEVCETA